jgi:DNA-directed RNA polymerase subunit RPC12/RpoP
MTRQTENVRFLCLNCAKNVEKLTNGSYRNHCPYCLYSLHVDNVPGDRANACGGLMKPTGLIYKRKKGWQLSHRCQKCGIHRVNKVAVGTIQPDDYKKLAKL